MKDSINTDQVFRIVSMKHTGKRDTYITLWGPDDAGYHFSKEMSGVYHGYVPGYHDSEGNMPITEEKAESLFIKVDYEGKEKHMIPNCKAVWEALGLKWTKQGLRRNISTVHA
jgi:hypothetical protein